MINFKLYMKSGSAINIEPCDIDKSLSTFEFLSKFWPTRINDNTWYTDKNDKTVLINQVEAIEKIEV